MDEARRMMEGAAQRRRLDEEESKRKYEEDSKGRLFRILETKLKTAFVGPLADFERFFGTVWGHGLAEEECSAEQLAWRPIWESCREAVLDRGNAQVKAVRKELERHTVKWERSLCLLPVKEQEEVAG